MRPVRAVLFHVEGRTWSLIVAILNSAKAHRRMEEGKQCNVKILVQVRRESQVRCSVIPSTLFNR